MQPQFNSLSKAQHPTHSTAAKELIRIKANCTLCGALTRSKQAADEALHEERIILDLNSGEYFGTSSVGGFIWDQLLEPQPLSGIATAIAAKFDIDQQQASADLLEFVSQLIERGLANVVDPE